MACGPIASDGVGRLSTLHVIPLLAQHVTAHFFLYSTATTEIYTLSLHDALPISSPGWSAQAPCRWSGSMPRPARSSDRKSTRLNSSHGSISYAVFCLKKKNLSQIGVGFEPLLLLNA